MQDSTQEIEEVLAYLRNLKDVLKIAAIGKNAGVIRLAKYVDGLKDGRGYSSPLPTKYLPALRKEIDRIKGKK